jgi:uncharacterized membrane protein YhaH (DUF805 family)
VQFTNLWDCDGRITRQIYFLTGLVAFLVKHYFDRALASGYGISWHIWNYWEPLTGPTDLGILTTAHLEFFVVRLLSALPFIWIGVTLTEKRLRDAGQPLWLTVLFFAPVVNLLLFAILCVLPSRNPSDTFAHSTNDTPSSYWPQGRLGSAALGAIVAGGLGIVVTWFDLRYWGIYGLTLFIALPFVMGYFAAWVHCRQHHRSFTDILAVCTLSVLIAGIGILAIAIEGAVCLFMAAPIAWILSCFGGLLAYKIHNDPAVHQPAPTTFAALLLALPALLGAEGFAPPPVPRYQVHSTMDITAPPDIVWKHLIAFPPITATNEWPFRFGIAYPIEAQLKGEGLNADRECRFSTGTFREPILVWEPGKHLAFAVADEPLLMKETSPYRNIRVRHLEDHDFQPERADFILTRLPGGGTRLEGTTTYQNKMWPGPYWHLWTDAIVHQIHHRVFRQVKSLSEADARAL